MYINTGRGSIDDRPEKIRGVFSVAVSSSRIKVIASTFLYFLKCLYSIYFAL